ncbi:MAG: hypothetical protein AB7Q97_01770 [Gammaproteobacteria bacterium]
MLGWVSRWLAARRRARAMRLLLEDVEHERRLRARIAHRIKYLREGPDDTNWRMGRLKERDGSGTAVKD